MGREIEFTFLPSALSYGRNNISAFYIKDSYPMIVGVYNIEPFAGRVNFNPCRLFEFALHAKALYEIPILVKDKDPVAGSIRYIYVAHGVCGYSHRLSKRRPPACLQHYRSLFLLVKYHNHTETGKIGRASCRERV